VESLPNCFLNREKTSGCWTEEEQQPSWRQHDPLVPLPFTEFPISRGYLSSALDLGTLPHLSLQPDAGILPPRYRLRVWLPRPTDGRR